MIISIIASAVATAAAAVAACVSALTSIKGCFWTFYGAASNLSSYFRFYDFPHEKQIESNSNNRFSVVWCAALRLWKAFAVAQ